MALWRREQMKGGRGGTPSAFGTSPCKGEEMSLPAGLPWRKLERGAGPPEQVRGRLRTSRGLGLAGGVGVGDGVFFLGWVGELVEEGEDVVG